MSPISPTPSRPFTPASTAAWDARNQATANPAASALAQDDAEVTSPAAAATPSTLYHASSSFAGDTTLTYSHLNAQVSGLVLSKRLAIADDIDKQFQSMVATYGAFKDTVARQHPELAGQDFGFTIDANGDLLATGVTGPAQAQLSSLLNANQELKSWALQMQERMRSYHPVEPAVTRLNDANFATTIDLGHTLNTLQPRTSAPATVQEQLKDAAQRFETKWMIQFDKRVGG